MIYKDCTVSVDGVTYSVVSWDAFTRTRLVLSIARVNRKRDLLGYFGHNRSARGGKYI